MLLRKKSSETVVGLELLVCMSTVSTVSAGLICSLRRSLRLSLVSPMYMPYHGFRRHLDG